MDLCTHALYILIVYALSTSCKLWPPSCYAPFLVVMVLQVSPFSLSGTPLPVKIDAPGAVPWCSLLRQSSCQLVNWSTAAAIQVVDITTGDILLTGESLKGKMADDTVRRRTV